MNFTELQEVLKKHEAWLKGEHGGEKADLPCDLYLSGTAITSLPDNVHHVDFFKPFIWRGGKYIMADRIFSEVLSHRGKVWKIRQVAS